MKTKKESSEVLYQLEKYKKIKLKDLDLLFVKSKKNKKKIIRLCTHDNKNSNLHEMFILHPKNYYVRPQMHPKKDESIILLNGKGIIFIFDNKGIIKEKLPLNKNNFYYKIPKKTYHCILILSKYITFYEVSLGPFKKENTIYAKWSPANDIKKIRNFQKKLLLSI